MAKVSDVLKLSVMRGVRVVAGEEGLFRKVEHVTVMEVPEIKRWLKGNDFLITSFYSVRKSEEDQQYKKVRAGELLHYMLSLGKYYLLSFKIIRILHKVLFYFCAHQGENHSEYFIPGQRKQNAHGQRPGCRRFDC